MESSLRWALGFRRFFVSAMGALGPGRFFVSAMVRNPLSPHGQPLTRGLMGLH